MISIKKQLVSIIRKVMIPVFREEIQQIKNDTIKQIKNDTIEQINNDTIEQFKNETIEQIKKDNPIKLVSGRWGYANSSKNLSDVDKMSIFLNFQYNEKLKVALSVASSYPGGDYLEFGSHDLYTMRNFLVAFDVGNLNSRFPQTQFYGFDIFGQYGEEELKDPDKKVKSYFDDFTHQGDLLETYNSLLDEFDVFRDRTHLIQGFFDKTLPAFKTPSKVGFAFLDCNITPSYQYVLSYIFDKVDVDSYIYADEYFDNSLIYAEVQRFKNKLIQERNLDLNFVRAAASVGALFRIVKFIDEKDTGDY